MEFVKRGAVFAPHSATNPKTRPVGWCENATVILAYRQWGIFPVRRPLDVSRTSTCSAVNAERVASSELRQVDVPLTY